MAEYHRQGGNLTVTVRGSNSTIPIPYAITLGGVNVAGVLYVADPIEDSSTDGAFIGLVVGTYHLDKDNLDACADNGLIKVCIRIDPRAKKLYGRLCKRKWNGGWDCDDWIEIISW